MSVQRAGCSQATRNGCKTTRTTKLHLRIFRRRKWRQQTERPSLSYGTHTRTSIRRVIKKLWMETWVGLSVILVVSRLWSMTSTSARKTTESMAYSLRLSIIPGQSRSLSHKRHSLRIVPPYPSAIDLAASWRKSILQNWARMQYCIHTMSPRSPKEARTMRRQRFPCRWTADCRCPLHSLLDRTLEGLSLCNRYKVWISQRSRTGASQ